MWRFHPNADGEIDRMYPFHRALLRSARDISGVITVSAGNASAYIKDIPYVGKTIALGYTFSVLDILVWDGSDPDNPYYIFPDGVYTLTIDAYPAYEGSTKQTYKFTFTATRKLPCSSQCGLSKIEAAWKYWKFQQSTTRRFQGALVYANIISFALDYLTPQYTKGQKTADT